MLWIIAYLIIGLLWALACAVSDRSFNLLMITRTVLWPLGVIGILFLRLLGR